MLSSAHKATFINNQSYDSYNGWWIHIITILCMNHTIWILFRRIFDISSKIWNRLTRLLSFQHSHTIHRFIIPLTNALNPYPIGYHHLIITKRAEDQCAFPNFWYSVKNWNQFTRLSWILLITYHSPLSWTLTNSQELTQICSYHISMVKTREKQCFRRIFDIPSKIQTSSSIYNQQSITTFETDQLLCSGVIFINW